MSTRLRLRRADGRVYLDRWGWECRRFGIFLHKMEAPDPGLDLHDHPWWFTSLILRGGYIEERARSAMASRYAAAAAEFGPPFSRGTTRRRRWLSIAATRRDYCHRITELARTPTWTIVLHGPKCQQWGFWLPTGWVYWEEYERTVRSERRDMWAEISNVDEERIGAAE